MGSRPAGLLLLLAACADNAPEPVATPPLDRTDPIAVARAALEAYRARDFEALGAVAEASARRTFSELAVEGPRHPRYRALFSGWRMEAVRAWDGPLPEVRYLETAGVPPEARVRFGTGPKGAFQLVVLVRERGEWRFKDLLEARPEHYRALKGASG